MKAHEIKYLMILEHLNVRPGATQAVLACVADMPSALVNRYLKRLTAWRMLRASQRRGKTKYALTPKGRLQLQRASWELLAFTSNELLSLRRRAVQQFAESVAKHAGSRAVLYGATPLAEVFRDWATEAGITTVALCDEESDGEGVVRLGDLDRRDYDCVVLSDWERADDAMLLRLLSEYGPVVNPFVIDGSARPEWR